MRDIEEKDAKTRIIDAAIRVFAVYGYYRAPLSLIAAEAGVSKSLILWYFRTKDALIHEVAVKSLPIDIIELCLSKGLSEAELLMCIGLNYLMKYTDPFMSSLLMQTISLQNNYSDIAKLLSDICFHKVGEIARRVFGKDDVSARTRIRTFFGSLMCYVLRPLPDIGRKSYVDEVLRLVLGS